MSILSIKALTTGGLALALAAAGPALAGTPSKATAKPTAHPAAAAKPAAAPAKAAAVTHAAPAKGTKPATPPKPAANGRMVQAKLSNGKTVTYNCSLPGNRTKQACKR